MGARIRAHDWASSPVGQIETWSPSLCSALRTALRSKFPTYLAWGPERISFYNDAYLPLLEGSRTHSDGRSRRSGPRSGTVSARSSSNAFQGEASYLEDLPLTMQRKGYPDGDLVDLLVQPHRDETGGSEGMLLHIPRNHPPRAHGTAAPVPGRSGTRLRGFADPREVMAAAAEMLGRHLEASRVGYGEIEPRAARPDGRARLDRRCHSELRRAVQARRFRPAGRRAS